MCEELTYSQKFKKAVRDRIRMFNAGQIDLSDLSTDIEGLAKIYDQDQFLIDAYPCLSAMDQIYAGSIDENYSLTRDARAKVEESIKGVLTLIRAIGD